MPNASKLTQRLKDSVKGSDKPAPVTKQKSFGVFSSGSTEKTQIVKRATTAKAANRSVLSTGGIFSQKIREVPGDYSKKDI